MREAGDRTGRIKQATSMPNCDSLKLNISSKIILLSNMCKFHKLVFDAELIFSANPKNVENIL